MLEEITKDTVKGKAIRELQSLRQLVLAGTTVATNIAAADTTVEGTTIVSVVEFDPAGPTFADLTAEAEITSDGNLQLDTTDTTGSQLLVWLYDKPIDE